MASSLSSTINRITPRESSNNLPKSHSFGRVYLSKGSKAELCRPFTCSVQSASSYTTTPLVKTSNSTDDDTSDTDNSITPALSSFWREVQGCNDWENLLDPLHPLLRQEIIRYGEFVTACYKAFDVDPASKRYLNCKYGKKRMFTEVGMGDCGYEVVKYIYATPEITIQNFPASCGRWIGFVAVSSDETTRQLGRRDIVITFRGTVTSQEWVANFMSSLIPAQLDPHNPRPDVKVESGFLSLYTSDEASTSKFGIVSCREQLLSEISRQLNKYKGENISLTMAGHSMGSALALLLAYDVAELELNRLGNTINGQKAEVPVTVFSFGGPRVGNLGFKNRCEELGVKVLRIANVNDPITKLPGVVFNNENFRVSGLGFFCYAHVGVELVLDFFSVQNPSCVHDLESYIGCLLKHSNVNSGNREEGFVGGFGFQIQVDEVMSNLMEKGRELLLSSHQNINVLPGLLSDAGNHHGVLGWNSRDLISSWGSELLFGLVLLLL